MKTCTKCGTSKKLSEFHKRTASKDGKASQCTTCLNTKQLKARTSRPDYTRNANLKARFDMSIEEYNVIFLKQRGKCAICDKAETSTNNKGVIKWLSVDHNHSTGIIRGLLCSNCNVGIGLLQDSVKIMKSAIKYLNKRGSYGE